MLEKLLTSFSNILNTTIPQLALCYYHLQYARQNLNSDGHTEDDSSIMPIEEVTLSPADQISLSAKRLEREDFWYRELCTVYPYGLNYNVRKVGNVLKCGPVLVVHTLFNRQLWKLRKRKMRKTKWKVEVRKLTEEVDTLLADYKCCNFCFRMCTLVLGLPRKYLLLLLNILENSLASHDSPAHIPLMVKDMIAYRKRAPNRPTDEVDKKRKQVHGVMVFIIKV